MKKVISYLIRKGDPGWPGNPTYDLTPFESMEKGDAANTYTISLFNHFGTHFDAPRHFNPNGLRIWEMPFDRFFYDAPLLIDIPKNAREWITAEDLMPYEAEIAKCDLLLIRTGFSKVRATDPQEFQDNSPAVSSGAAKYLMEHFCGSLKSIALDCLSLGMPHDTSTEGVEAHRTMLGMYHDGYICIIEDVNMTGLEADGMKRAASIPLFMDGTDSGPVTMWVEY